MNCLLLVAVVVITYHCWTIECQPAKHYEPNWASLDSRPLPAWYDQAKVGIMLHWGVYSVPAFWNEWFAYHYATDQWDKHAHQEITKWMAAHYPAGFKYEQFAPMFTASKFNPDQWADLFRKSGAKYVVLTAKHHDGYALWPAPHSPHWNSVDIGPHRDLVGDLTKAVKAHGLRMGLYHSLLEWFHPWCLEDEHNQWRTHRFAQNKVWPELQDLVNRYHPSIIWSDGTWKADDRYWNSTGMLAWLFNQSPVRDEVVVNDRWGTNTECHHGSFWNCHDSYLADKVLPHKWENAMRLNRGSWAWKDGDTVRDFLTLDELLPQLIQTVAFGGNILIDIGPTKEGIISHYFSDVLLGLGEWLTVNGEAIYESRPWSRSQHDSHNKAIFYTQRAGHVYGLVLTHNNASHPVNGQVEFGDLTAEQVKSVTMLGHSTGALKHSKSANNRLHVELPAKHDPHAVVYRFELH